MHGNWNTLHWCQEDARQFAWRAYKEPRECFPMSMNTQPSVLAIFFLKRLIAIMSPYFQTANMIYTKQIFVILYYHKLVTREFEPANYKTTNICYFHKVPGAININICHGRIDWFCKSGYPMYKSKTIILSHVENISVTSHIQNLVQFAAASNYGVLRQIVRLTFFINTDADNIISK